MKKLGRDCGIAFHALDNDLLRLRSNWQEYTSLFGTNPQRIALLNESAPRFFHMLQGDLFEATLMHLCRMTDPPKSAGKRTVSLLGVLAIAPPEIRRKLTPLINKAQARTVFARDWRNRHIGHHDLERTLSNSALAKATRAKVGTAIEAIHDALAPIHLKYFGYEPERLPPTVAANGAEELIRIIRAGLRHLKRRDEAFIRGDTHYPDEDSDPI